MRTQPDIRYLTPKAQDHMEIGKLLDPRELHDSPNGIVNDVEEDAVVRRDRGWWPGFLARRAG